MQGNLTVLDSQFRAMDTAFWILCQWNLDSEFQYYYKWDPQYLTFFQIPKPGIPDSKRKISRIPDSLTLGDSDPKINMFSVKPNPVN